MSPDKVEHIRCRSADDLFDRIRPTGQGIDLTTLYRGLGNADFRLVPSALRDYDVKIQKPLSLELTPTASWVAFKEAQLLRHFVEACDRIGIAIPGDSDELRKLLSAYESPDYFVGVYDWPRKEHDALWAVAQHHGLPTRLLDWSKSPLVACYFAASSCLTSKTRKKPRDFAVWSMDPWAAEGTRLRIVSVAPAHSRNLAAQLGVFTLTPQTSAEVDSPVEVLAVDEIAQCSVPPFPFLELPSKSPLRKYTLDRYHAANLLGLCEAYGISGATMFPSLEGACRQAVEKDARLAIQGSSTGYC